MSEAVAAADRLRLIEDRLDIVEAIHRLAWCLDRRDWDGLADVFAPDVDVDYSSIDGRPPETVAREDLVAKWRAALSGLLATQHLTANHIVIRPTDDPDVAVCLAAVRSMHYLPNPGGSDTWSVGGHYRYRLVRLPGGWRVRAVTLTADWVAGNQSVMALSAQASGQ